jgi:SAM-dependent methyltransferase
MCGLIKCSSYCPAKYADQWEPLEERDNLAPYLGSNWEVIDFVFDICNISNDSKVLDLGAGDGRVLIRAVQRGAQLAVGYELNKSVYELGRSQVKAFDNIELINGDCRSITNIRDFNVITLFLLPDGLKMIEPFLSAVTTTTTTTTTTTVVSLGWPIPNWPITKKEISEFGTLIYIYKRHFTEGNTI